MKYEYTFRNTAGDYALFYLGNTYHSMMAIVNLIFTAVIQPLAIYVRSTKDVKQVNQVDTWIGFDDAGMHIKVKEHEQLIRWHDFYPVVKRKAMLVVIPDGIHAYLLTNRILGTTKDELYAYITDKVNTLSVHKDEK